MGHTRLHEVMVEKDALYAKPDFSDDDGIARGRARGASSATSTAGTPRPTRRAAQRARHRRGRAPGALVKDLEDGEKVRVLLAQALFGEPDILLLDEPTNHLDVDSILWLEEFLLELQEHRDRRLPRPPLPRQGVHAHRRRGLPEGHALHAATTPSGTRRASSRCASAGVEPQQGRPDQGAEDVHPALQRQRVEVASRPPRARRCSTRSRSTTSSRRRASTRTSCSRPQRELGKDVLFVDGTQQEHRRRGRCSRTCASSLAKGEKRRASSGDDLAHRRR